jgi:5-methylcytosine-specific restriction endonuclease McrA
VGGKAHGSRLEADHIKPFCRFPELRLVVSNGRTLCKDCHRKTPTWGARAVA